jgi:hypothetical protein
VKHFQQWCVILIDDYYHLTSGLLVGPL